MDCFSCGELKCVEVTPEKIETLQLFKKFYDEIYVDAFPDKNERVLYDVFLDCIGRYDSSALYVRVLLFTIDDDVVGGIVYDYFDEIMALAIEFIVVSKIFQGRGLATKIMKFTKEFIRNQYKKKIEWTFIEIENPSLVSHRDFSYLKFWLKHNMKKIDFPYIQPALSLNQNTVETLLLCVCHETFDFNEISIDTVKVFLWNYVYHTIGIKCPEEDASIKTMFRILDNREGDTLSLLSLDEVFS